MNAEGKTTMALTGVSGLSLTAQTQRGRCIRGAAGSLDPPWSRAMWTWRECWRERSPLASSCLTAFSPPRSTSTSSPVRLAATFPPTTHCPLGSTLDGVYPTLMEPVLLPKESPRLTRTERPRADAGHAFLNKPPAREPASSPSKSAEPRPLAPPSSSHAAIAHAPAKSLAPHHASPDPPAPPASASDPHRGKTQSKPFSIQELELRSLGKTTLTAATFIDAIIMRQIAHDKGPREGGSRADDSPRHGKRPGHHPPSRGLQILPDLCLLSPPPFFVGLGVPVLSPSLSICTL